MADRPWVVLPQLRLAGLEGQTPASIQAGIITPKSRSYLEKVPRLAVHEKQLSRGDSVRIQMSIGTGQPCVFVRGSQGERLGLLFSTWPPVGRQHPGRQKPGSLTLWPEAPRKAGWQRTLRRVMGPGSVLTVTIRISPTGSFGGQGDHSSFTCLGFQDARP